MCAAHMELGPRTYCCVSLYSRAAHVLTFSSHSRSGILVAAAVDCADSERGRQLTRWDCLQLRNQVSQALSLAVSELLTITASFGARRRSRLEKLAGERLVPGTEGLPPKDCWPPADARSLLFDARCWLATSGDAVGKSLPGYGDGASAPVT